MHLQKRAAFSSDGVHFACISEKENLVIWETASNKLINDNFVWKVNACSCIRWIPMQQNCNYSKKAALTCEDILLAAGNVKGDILIYNIKAKSLFLHLSGRHHGAINDMCLYNSKKNLLFTCSDDQNIAIWDISTGGQISKWKADENPISSICVIDDENLLSSSTVILWWNISEKTILKKFSGHSTEIIKLLPVNGDSVKSCYFLSAAVDDAKINAWSLNSSECEASVASFSLPVPPEDMDISKISSKDKPLMLSAVTKDGYLHIFEHTLNGKISDLVKPKVSKEIDPECEKFSVLSVKLLSDEDECIIAYSSSKSTVAFKHVKIKELVQKGDKTNISSSSQSPVKLSLVNESSIAGKNLAINGLSGYKSKLRSSTKFSLASDLGNPTEMEASMESQLSNQVIDLHNPKSALDALLEAIEAQNDNIIETIFSNNDLGFISSVVELLQHSSLKIVVKELNRRLLQNYSITLCRWLKQILQVHLRYLTQCEDAVETLNQTRKLLSCIDISKTLHKMTVVQGLLNIQIQNSSSESDSDEEPMDL